MDFAFDVWRLRREWFRRHVLMARYMRTSPEEVMRMWVQDRDAYFLTLTDVVRSESKPTVPTED